MAKPWNEPNLVIGTLYITNYLKKYFDLAFNKIDTSPHLSTSLSDRSCSKKSNSRYLDLAFGKIN